VKPETTVSVSGMQVKPSPAITQSAVKNSDLIDNNSISIKIDNLADTIEKLSANIVNNNGNVEIPEIIVETPKVEPSISVEFKLQVTPEITLNNDLSGFATSPDIRVYPKIDVEANILTDFSSTPTGEKTPIAEPEISYEPIEKILQSISSQSIGITSIDGEVKSINTKLDQIPGKFSGEIKPLIEKQLTNKLNDTSDIPQHDTVKFADLEELMDLQDRTESDMMKTSAFKHSLRDDDPKNVGKMYWPEEQIQLFKMLLEQQNTIIELIKMSVAMNGVPQEYQMPEQFPQQSFEQQESPITAEDLANMNQNNQNNKQDEEPKKQKIFGKGGKIVNWLKDVESSNNRFGRFLDGVINTTHRMKGEQVKFGTKRDNRGRRNRSR
jgi:hypothetical protein